jgi:enoyl-CoA hydratase/carnithine racemase
MSAAGTARTSEHVRFEVRDEVATLRLDRPEKRNALSRDMWLAIIDHLRDAEADATVRALVVRGAPGVFCAGADLAAVKNADPAVAAEYEQIGAAGYDALRAFPRPTLAAIDGLCIGGGCSIALACDVRIAGPQASFAIPAVRHGIVYRGWAVDRLVELVGSGRAAHFLLTAGRIDVERAAAIGLVDIRTDDLDAEVEAYLDALRAGHDHVISAICAQIRGTPERRGGGS